MFFDEEIEKTIKENCKKEKDYKDFNENVISRIKDDVEKLWIQYEKFAPEKFQENAIKSKEEFYDRWWEMFFGCELINQGYQDIKGFGKKDIGLDFKILVEDQVYWIETVAPGLGMDSNPYHLPKMEYDSNPIALPKDQYLLRLRNSIENKRNQFNRYLSNGIVDSSDKKIIAISTCNLCQYGSLMDFPVLSIESLLFNIGNISISIETGEEYLLPKNGINVKVNNETKMISTNLIESLDLIDGIIYTHNEPLNTGKEIYLIELNQLNNTFKRMFSTTSN